jgi:hypothetical protein
VELFIKDLQNQLHRGGKSEVAGTIPRLSAIDNAADPSLNVKVTRTGVTSGAEAYEATCRERYNLVL